MLTFKQKTEFRSLMFRLKRLQVWKEGFEANKNRSNFSMTPYPIPQKSYCDQNQRYKARYWSSGYWAFNKFKKICNSIK